MQFTPSACAGDKPLRAEDHHHDKYDAKDQVTNIAEGEAGNDLSNRRQDRMQDVSRISGQCIELRENKLVDSIDSQRPNDNPGDTPNSTDNHHSQVNHRVTKAKVIH